MKTTFDFLQNNIKRLDEEVQVVAFLSNLKTKKLKSMKDQQANIDFSKDRDAQRLTEALDIIIDGMQETVTIFDLLNVSKSYSDR